MADDRARSDFGRDGLLACGAQIGAGDGEVDVTLADFISVQRVGLGRGKGGACQQQLNAVGGRRGRRQADAHHEVCLGGLEDAVSKVGADGGEGGREGDGLDGVHHRAGHAQELGFNGIQARVDRAVGAGEGLEAGDGGLERRDRCGHLAQRVEILCLAGVDGADHSCERRDQGFELAQGVAGGGGRALEVRHRIGDRRGVSRGEVGDRCGQFRTRGVGSAQSRNRRVDRGDGVAYLLERVIAGQGVGLDRVDHARQCRQQGFQFAQRVASGRGCALEARHGCADGHGVGRGQAAEFGHQLCVRDVDAALACERGVDGGDCLAYLLERVKGCRCVGLDGVDHAGHRRQQGFKLAQRVTGGRRRALDATHRCADCHAVGRGQVVDRSSQLSIRGIGAAQTRNARVDRGDGVADFLERVEGCRCVGLDGVDHAGQRRQQSFELSECVAGARGSARQASHCGADGRAVGCGQLRARGRQLRVRGVGAAQVGDCGVDQGDGVADFLERVKARGGVGLDRVHHTGQRGEQRFELAECVAGARGSARQACHCGADRLRVGRAQVRARGRQLRVRGVGAAQVGDCGVDQGDGVADFLERVKARGGVGLDRVHHTGQRGEQRFELAECVAGARGSARQACHCGADRLRVGRAQVRARGRQLRVRGVGAAQVGQRGVDRRDRLAYFLKRVKGGRRVGLDGAHHACQRRDHGLQLGQGVALARGAAFERKHRITDCRGIGLDQCRLSIAQRRSIGVCEAANGAVDQRNRQADGDDLVTKLFEGVEAGGGAGLDDVDHARERAEQAFELAQRVAGGRGRALEARHRRTDCRAVGRAQLVECRRQLCIRNVGDAQARDRGVQRGDRVAYFFERVVVAQRVGLDGVDHAGERAEQRFELAQGVAGAGGIAFQASHRGVDRLSVGRGQV